MPTPKKDGFAAFIAARAEAQKAAKDEKKGAVKAAAKKKMSAK